MSKSKDDLLVLSAQQGNSVAFAELYKNYQKALVRYAYKICNNAEVAQDVCQDVWLETAKKLRMLNDPRAFKSWLYKTVRWRCIDVLRKDKKLSREQVSEVGFDPSDVLNTQSDLMKAILRLGRKEQEVVYLFYLEDMSVKEISHVIKVPVGTVKSRLSKARKNLQELLS